MAKTRIQGYAEEGNGVAVTDLSGSSIDVSRAFPLATVSVFLAGTLTPATTYRDASGTSLPNPFTADENAYWFCYLDPGTYDITFSGGGIAIPFTLSSVTVAVTAVFSPFSVAPAPSGSDDFATIQSLINTNNPLGIAVVLRQGIYLTSAELSPAPGFPLLLFGSGHRYNTSTGTVIRATTAGMRSVLVMSESYSTVSGLKIDPNRLADYGILLRGCVGSRFVTGAIQNALLDGFHSDPTTLNQLNETDGWFSTDNGRTYATAAILPQYPASPVRQPVITGTAATTAGVGVITISGGPDLTTLPIRTGFAGDMVRVSDEQTLTSLTSVGTTATGTTTTAHGWASGQLIVIVGATPSAYNGSYLIVATPTATTFTYAFAGGTSPATGTITVNNATTSFYGQITSVTATTITLHPSVNGWPTRTVSGAPYAIGVGWGWYEESNAMNGFCHMHDSWFRGNGAGGVFMNALYGDHVGVNTLCDFNNFSGIALGLISNNTVLFQPVASHVYMEGNIGPDYVIGAVRDAKIDIPSGNSPLFSIGGGVTSSNYAINRSGTTENSFGKPQNFLFIIQRVGGVIKHQIVAELRDLNSSSAVDRVNGASPVLAITPIGASALDATHGFVSGAGILSGTTNFIIFDTPGGYMDSGQFSATAVIEVQKISSGTQSTVPLRVQPDVLTANNVNGVTRNRLIFIVSNGFTGASADLTSGANGLPVDGDFIAIRFNGPIK